MVKTPTSSGDGYIILGINGSEITLISILKEFMGLSTIEKKTYTQGLISKK